MSGRLLGPGVIAAVARRPDLWPTAAAVGLRLATPGWWRRWPPLPLPPEGYTRFRLQTMYGAGGEAALEAGDVVGLLEWCRRQPRAKR